MHPQEFIDTYNGKAVVIPGYATAECVALFWRYNLDVNAGEPYSAPGAANLWTHVSGYPYLWETYERVAGPTSGRPGDWAIWSGSRGAYPNGGYGHVAMFVRDLGNGTGVFFTQNPGNAGLHPLSYDGILGFLRPKGVPPLGAPVDAGVYHRTVTQDVAWARVGPSRGALIAPDYPDGIAKGAKLAVIGYVAGEDPYGTGDDAWYKTVSGYYVWANAAENNIAGLPRLN